MYTQVSTVYTPCRISLSLLNQDHRKLYELSALNAKFRYIELCRSLRTYGVSFFAVKVCVHNIIYNYVYVTRLCVCLFGPYTACTCPPHQEKTPSRNKLRPVLLGVSREGVHRLDKASKTLLQRWPLSTVQSFASTPTSFCLVCVLGQRSRYNLYEWRERAWKSRLYI